MNQLQIFDRHRPPAFQCCGEKFSVLSRGELLVNRIMRKVHILVEFDVYNTDGVWVWREHPGRARLQKARG